MPVVRPCPYVARAWWGDRLLAESAQALRVDDPDRPPTLWFPWEDVVAAGLHAAGRDEWDGGELERFDIDALAPARQGPVTWWGDDRGVPIDGAGAVRRCVAPPSALAALAGYATIDADRARVELVDAVDGLDPRDVTVKRFPTWGDATDLVAVLDGGLVVPNHRRSVVEGSQMLGRAIVAAMRRAPGRRVVSAHMAFLRPADAARPMAVLLDALSEGRAFTAYSARGEQDGRRCASGTLLLAAPAADVVRHAASADGVPGPYDAVPVDMGVTGRDIRVVDGAYTDDPAAPVGPPSIDAWVRLRGVPDDPALHAGMLAHFSGHMSIAAALRPHPGVGQREAHRTISTTINAITISFHDDVRVDRWVLYRHLSTVAAGGMTHSECRVHDEARRLVASFAVDAMVRPLHRPGDLRTVL